MLDDIRKERVSDPKDTSDREGERDLPARRLSHGNRTELRDSSERAAGILRSIRSSKTRSEKYRDFGVEVEEEINLR